MSDRLNFMTNQNVLDVLLSPIGNSYPKNITHKSEHPKNILSSILNPNREENSLAQSKLFWNSPQGKHLAGTMQGIEDETMPNNGGRYFRYPDGRVSNQIEDIRDQSMPSFSFWDWLTQDKDNYGRAGQ